jgi:hypothetical protein
MLSSVPVARLLEGVAAALREHVEPHVTDRFAQMQLRAIDELLRNLAGRVEWSLAELSREVADIERLLDTLKEVGLPAEDDDARLGKSAPLSSVDAASEARAALLVSVTRAINWVQDVAPASGATRSVVTDYLRAANERERTQLKSGMYS